MINRSFILHGSTDQERMGALVDHYINASRGHGHEAASRKICASVEKRTSVAR